MDGSTRGEVVRRIVERQDLDAFAERVLDSFWDRPEYRPFRPPRVDVLAWVRWNIGLVVRWLVEGQPPTRDELESFRERARARVADGMPADVVPGNFRRGARFAWAALLEAARPEERPALLDGADLLFEYIDQVSRMFSTTYDAAGAALAVPADEQRARTLLAQLTSGEGVQGEHHGLAERIGFPLRAAYLPFALSSPAVSVQQHMALAARLRGRGVLAVAEGRRVAGLSTAAVEWDSVGVGTGARIAAGERTDRPQLGEALDELRAVVEIAGERGIHGLLDSDDYLAELLVRRSPRVAARIRRRVYGPLDPELTRTLDLLLEHEFDRSATAAAIPAHRNTLTNRLARIRELTGVDLDGGEGRALAWLARLERGSA